MGNYNLPPLLEPVGLAYRLDENMVGNSAGLRKVLEFKDKVREIEIGLIDT